VTAVTHWLDTTLQLKEKWEECMEMVPWTGQNADLRLSPREVGFDLRLVGISVILPAQFTSVELEKDGQVYWLTGTREEMIAAIRDAGYTVAEEPA